MDAITGEGISLALEEAEAAAELGGILSAVDRPLSSLELRPFEAAYRRITSNYRLTTRILLRLSRHPALTAGVVRFLARHPRFMQVLLSVNMGTLTPLRAVQKLF